MLPVVRSVSTQACDLHCVSKVLPFIDEVSAIIRPRHGHAASASVAKTRYREGKRVIESPAPNLTLILGRRRADNSDCADRRGILT